ncbi:MAG: hypothetical protein PWQ09_1245 [Candidatus Cloacimonadota bacterium]|jgi:hypothetical protein|nr:hypothetical protein [Candidatus Cloacimonadota bacterium]
MTKPQYGFREGDPLSLWQAIKSGKAFKMLLKGEIPERFRSWEEIVKYNRKFFFRCIHKTPPIACEKSAKVSIHSLVCHMDLEMYLLAVKSFLRFYPKVQIIAHSDSSLSADDITKLRKHIPNIDVIDETNKLWQHSLNRVKNDFVAKGHSNLLLIKLFLPFFCKSERLIILDTDIIFINRPDEVISWIENNSQHLTPLYNKDKYDTLRDAKTSLMKEFNISELPPNLNSGFICMQNDVTKMEFERLLKISINYTDSNIDKGDQTIFHILLAKRNAQPLSKDHYNIFDGYKIPKQAKMIHFPTHVRFKKGYYLKLARKLCHQFKIE